MGNQIQINPEWATDETIEAIFGLPRTRLYELRRDGEIRYKRLPLRKEGSGVRRRVLNNVASIRQWLENLPDPEPWDALTERDRRPVLAPKGESPPTEAGAMAATNPT